MKKTIFGIGTVLVLLVSACESSLADNSGNTPLANVRSALYDTVSGCAIEEVHTHNSIAYSGHYNNDGHGHLGLLADTACVVTSCGEIGLHQHNGVHYAGHAGNDGCNHHGNEHHL